MTLVARPLQYERVAPGYVRHPDALMASPKAVVAIAHVSKRATWFSQSTTAAVQSEQEDDSRDGRWPSTGPWEYGNATKNRPIGAAGDDDMNGDTTGCRQAPSMPEYLCQS
jgi:hypothetical protein